MPPLQQPLPSPAGFVLPAAATCTGVSPGPALADCWPGALPSRSWHPPCPCSSSADMPPPAHPPEPCNQKGIHIWKNQARMVTVQLICGYSQQQLSPGSANIPNVLILITSIDSRATQSLLACKAWSAFPHTQHVNHKTPPGKIMSCFAFNAGHACCSILP